MSPWRLDASRADLGWALGLDAQRWALREPGTAADRRITGAHGDFGPSPSPSSVTQARGAPVDIVAANDIALHWVQASPRSIASLEELHQVARSRCAHLFGGQPGDWWVTGDWSTRHAFVCAALPMAVVEPLRTQLVEMGLKPRWHTAWGLLARLRASAFPEVGWCAMRGAAHVLLWHCSAGRVDSLTTVAVAPATPTLQVAQRSLVQLQVQKSRADLPGDVLHWLDLTGLDDPRELMPAVTTVPFARPQPAQPDASDAEIALALVRLLHKAGTA